MEEPRVLPFVFLRQYSRKLQKTLSAVSRKFRENIRNFFNYFILSFYAVTTPLEELRVRPFLFPRQS